MPGFLPIPLPSPPSTPSIMAAVPPVSQFAQNRANSLGGGALNGHSHVHRDNKTERDEAGFPLRPPSAWGSSSAGIWSAGPGASRSTADLQSHQRANGSAPFPSLLSMRSTALSSSLTGSTGDNAVASKAWGDVVTPWPNSLLARLQDNSRDSRQSAGSSAQPRPQTLPTRFTKSNNDSVSNDEARRVSFGSIGQPANGSSSFASDARFGLGGVSLAVSDSDAPSRSKTPTRHTLMPEPQKHVVPSLSLPPVQPAASHAWLAPSSASSSSNTATAAAAAAYSLGQDRLGSVTFTPPPAGRRPSTFALNVPFSPGRGGTGSQLDQHTHSRMASQLNDNAFHLNAATPSVHFSYQPVSYYQPQPWNSTPDVYGAMPEHHINMVTDLTATPYAPTPRRDYNSPIAPIHHGQRHLTPAFGASLAVASAALPHGRFNVPVHDVSVNSSSAPYGYGRLYAPAALGPLFSQQHMASYVPQLPPPPSLPPVQVAVQAPTYTLPSFAAQQAHQPLVARPSAHAVEKSAFLQEFRSRQTKRYELKDIYGYILEFSGDQVGSRFIQSKLETANSEEKEQVFRELEANEVQLMKDVFGNYVIQKLFEHGNQIQKKRLASLMKGKMVHLSTQTYACRVVQKAIEHILVDQQAELAAELQPDILQLIMEPNGNHVIQKVIEAVPPMHTLFIVNAVRGSIAKLATHTYGCRVIQRLMEHATEVDKIGIMQEIHDHTNELVTDQFGNYVAQHVIQHGSPEHRHKMIMVLAPQVVKLSRHKFASNVIERCIEHGNDADRRMLIDYFCRPLADGRSGLSLLAADQYGNYVMQKCLLLLPETESREFALALLPYIGEQRAGCRTRDALERRLPLDLRRELLSTVNGLPAAVQPSEGNNSDSHTPPLTQEPNTPQSSDLPSITHSTVDDGTHDKHKLAPNQSSGHANPATNGHEPSN